MKKEMELVFIADQLQTQIREILIERGIDSVITLPELSSLSEINFNVKSDDKNVDENDFEDVLDVVMSYPNFIVEFKTSTLESMPKQTANQGKPKAPKKPSAKN